MSGRKVRYRFDDGTEYVLPLENVLLEENQQLRALLRAKAEAAKLARAKGGSATRAKAKQSPPALPAWIEDVFGVAYRSLEAAGRKRIGRDSLRHRARRVLADRKMDPAEYPRAALTERCAEHWLKARKAT